MSVTIPYLRKRKESRQFLRNSDHGEYWYILENYFSVEGPPCFKPVAQLSPEHVEASSHMDS